MDNNYVIILQAADEEDLWLNCTLLTKVLVHVGGCDVDCEKVLNRSKLSMERNEGWS